MIDRNRLLQLCYNGLVDKGLEAKPYKDRLVLEIKEVDAQAEHEYFLDLYDGKHRFPNNENNSLIPFLLGIVDDFDIEREPQYNEVFEFPDIDIDYLPQVRDYLKNIWAPDTFGRDKVCNIGNYTTFGIKSSLIDMARVHGEDRNEILALTTHLGLKDDEGNKLTWDKAIELHPDLAEYCKEHPEVADSAKRLLNRNRGIGMHAGGLIISKVPIDDFVPLVRGKGNTHASAWVEGLAGTDLGPVGLVKFDLLVITDLLRIVHCCKLIKQRHGIKSISALLDQPDWSDISYLNDIDALVMANDGKLKGVFQFDSIGIRNLVKMGGVTSFDDLPAYSSLYRPGPLGMKMHERYVMRKRKNEEWENQLHPLMKSILADTYGVMIYQEQVMKILNVVGEIPEMHTEKVRKAISKKRLDQFGKYKELFFKNAEKNLGWPIEKEGDDQSNTVRWLWDQIESFADYGFNRAHAYAYSYISARLLWLKAHYSLEFFAATLKCEHDDKKIKEYKLEAERQNVQLERLSLNKSDVLFEIVDDKIYIGFANVKGIGEEVAKEIVARQPYSSLTDFLERFGTTANVVKPLCALGVFGGGEEEWQVRWGNWMFCQHYKIHTKRRDDRNKRNAMSREKLVEEMSELLIAANGYESTDDAKYFLETFRKGQYEKREEFFRMVVGSDGQEQIPGLDVEAAWKIGKKYQRNVDGFEAKVAEDEPIVVENFQANDEDVEEIFLDRRLAESEYYGFSWDHPLQECEKFDPEMTFLRFQEDETMQSTSVQVIVKGKVEKKTSRNNNVYWQVRLEDAYWNIEKLNVWEDEWKRFKEEFSFWDEIRKRGNFLQLRVKRPAPGFRTYSLDSPGRRFKHTLPKNKEDDYRVIQMTPPPEQIDLMEELRNDRRSSD